MLLFGDEMIDTPYSESECCVISRRNVVFAAGAGVDEAVVAKSFGTEFHIVLEIVSQANRAGESCVETIIALAVEIQFFIEIVVLGVVDIWRHGKSCLPFNRAYRPKSHVSANVEIASDFIAAKRE